jgi:hypothetical protein
MMETLLPSPVHPAFERIESDGGAGKTSVCSATTDVAGDRRIDGEKITRVTCTVPAPGLRNGSEDQRLANLIARGPPQLLLVNNFAYCEAVETLMGVDHAAPRYLRTLLNTAHRRSPTCKPSPLMNWARHGLPYLVMIRDTSTSIWPT